MKIKAFFKIALAAISLISLSILFRQQVNAGNHSARPDTAKQQYRTVYQSNTANLSSKKEDIDPPQKGADGY